jgi:hypothetical protein
MQANFSNAAEQWGARQDWTARLWQALAAHREAPYGIVVTRVSAEANQFPKHNAMPIDYQLW